MAGGTASADLRNQLGTLSELGVVGNLSDGALLERIVHGRDGAAQAAFTVLIERHGPMVLSVCRQAIANSHDAEDAFQATFLVLARNAASVRKAESVASWLHGVALRVAKRAKADVIRRGRLRAAEHRDEGERIRACGGPSGILARAPRGDRPPAEPLS